MKKSCVSSCIFALIFLSVCCGNTYPETAGKAPIPLSEQRFHPAGLYNPVANPKAVVVLGHARFTVLTPQLIRMEWAADGKFEDHASLVFLNRNLSVPAFTQKLTSASSGQTLTLRTDKLTLTYKLAAGSDGKFTANDLQISFWMQGHQVIWHAGMADTGNLHGTTRTLDGVLGSKLDHPLDPGLISRNGWVVVDDSTRPLFDSTNFQFSHGEASPWPWVMLRPAGDRQDWYFFGYGHHYKRALGDFVVVAGRIPLPPRFAFGAWWSRYWAYSDQELDALVRGFRENDVPLDVLVIDMDWHPTFGQKWWNSAVDQSGHTLGWTGYSWSQLLFPDPTAFLAKIHQEGLKVTLNLHPAGGIEPWETRYPEMARAMGIDPATKKYVPLDITSKKFTTNYFDLILHPLEKQGVNFWWLDWQEADTTKLPGVGATWWLNYIHFTDQAREGKRPLLFHRWGGLGNHRYQIGFSGDTISAWPSLAFQPWFTATAANVGYAYWSHDIGGHMPGAVGPELFTRWVQFGAFSPILRTHTTKNPESERRIWAYPEPYSDIMRDTFHLRYALVPYIYTEARRTYDTGVAFLRPLYYNWPNADQAYSSKNEYQFGKEMLVAPVTTPVDKVTQLATVPIWLPQGNWIEWPTGRHFTGPVQMERKFSIRQIPVYVPDGAIIPMAPPMLYTSQKPLDPLILTIFPSRSGETSNYTLYEDAGNTRAYQQDQAAWTTIHAKETNGDLTVEIDPARGSYPGMLRTRRIELRLPEDWPPASVVANGKHIERSTTNGMAEWRYEGNTLTTVISLASSPVTQRTVIHIRRDAALVQRRSELDGFAGAMTRLKQTYDTLNQTFPLAWSPDSLVDVMQTGDRLTYHPETAAVELAHFHAELPKALEDVRKLKGAFTPDDLKRIADTLGPNWKQSVRLAEYQSHVVTATAQMEDAIATASSDDEPKQTATR